VSNCALKVSGACAVSLEGSLKSGEAAEGCSLVSGGLLVEVGPALLHEVRAKLATSPNVQIQFDIFMREIFQTRGKKSRGN
jgi:hypothetical protein